MGCKIINYGSAISASTLDAYYLVSGGYYAGGPTTVDPRAGTKVYRNTTYSRMFAYITANTHAGTTTFRFRKNGSNGSQSFTVAGGLTGFFQDITNSDIAVSGDVTTILMDRPGSGNSSSQLVGVITDTGKVAIPIISTYGTLNISAASTSTSIAIAGNFRSGVDSIVGRIPATYAYTSKNLQIYVFTNGRSTASVFKQRLNNSDAGPTITIGAGLTGLFEDPVNTGSYAVGNQNSYYFVTGTGTGAIAASFASHEQEFTDNSYMQYSCEIVGRSISGLTTQYIALQGMSAPTTTEASQQQRMTGSGVFRDLSMYVSSSTSTDTQIYTLRKNGADTAMNLSVPAGSTGTFTNSTNQVSYVDGDLISLKITRASGTGSVTHRYITLGTRASTGFTPKVILT